MTGEPPSKLQSTLAGIKARYPNDIAVTMIMGMLMKEYERLDNIMKEVRQRYLSMNADDPGQEHEIADLRLQAVEAYQPAYLIESFLTEMDADITPIVPAYDGEFEPSSAGKKGWDLSFVSLKESAMRSLGGHCNVIGEVIMLERKLYHHTYLAAVMQPTHGDNRLVPSDAVTGEILMEYHFSTVVFDEDVNTLVEKQDKRS